MGDASHLTGGAIILQVAHFISFTVAHTFLTDGTWKPQCQQDLTVATKLLPASLSLVGTLCLNRHYTKFWWSQISAHRTFRCRSNYSKCSRFKYTYGLKLKTTLLRKTNFHLR